MENNIVQRFGAATMAAEAAVNATFEANLRANTAMESMLKLRSIATQATADLDYALNNCEAYTKQMQAMSLHMQQIREARDFKEMEEILPQATKLNEDSKAAHDALEQALKHARKAVADYEQARIGANNLVTEAARLAKEAQEAIDYANQLGQNAYDAL